MFEVHDRSRFETTAITIGPNDNSGMRRRLKGAFDHFLEARELKDAEIASRVREREIDILVDLKGYTQYARTDIVALRPAPTQISYLGYPGTMGAPYIDYLIADGTIVPDGNEKYYSEKIIRLPGSYQVNDRSRCISDRAMTRSEHGLPQDGFVFCCFNNNYKITPALFDRWMTILRRVDGSALWLFEGTAAGAEISEKRPRRGAWPRNAWCSRSGYPTRTI